MGHLQSWGQRQLQQLQHQEQEQEHWQRLQQWWQQQRIKPRLSVGQLGS
jgi:hypothetical protein